MPAPDMVVQIGGAPAPAAAAAMFVVLGAVAAVVYLLDLSTITTTGAFAGVGIGCVVALVEGPRWNRAVIRRPWTLLAIAAAVFLVGALIRPWAADQAGATVLLADAFTVPGYIFSVLGLGGLLWARGLERHALIDGLIVGVGVGVVFAVLFSLPAASIEGRPAAVSALAAVYPFFDVVLVLIVASLAFTTAVRSPSYLLLVGCASLLLIGDVAYAIIGTSGDLTGSRLLDLPFLFGFALLGASALHPSMVELGRGAPVPVQAWSWPRLLLIVPALGAPFALTALVPEPSPTGRWVLAVGGASLVSLLLTRAVSAVHAYSAARRRYQHQATHDYLTGLPNRLMLSAQVDRRLMAERPLAGSEVWVFYVDLDGFKLVNDSRGHQVGDQVIVEVARRLRSCVPDAAEVARVGGDEFVVIQVGRRSKAAQLADRILECFAAPLHVRSVEVMITASVGVASAPVGGRTSTTAEALLRDADTAMYRAKSEGPGKWTMFDASMHERVRERVDIELALRHALAENQMHVAYQPIVGLTDGTLLGAEALLRWNHPVRGAIAPTTFIPVAEDTGMISAIGGWVVHESLRQLAAWRARRLVPEDFWISINVSPRQLRDPGLPGMIAEALTQHDLPAHNVVLEITESVTIDQSNIAENVLRDLRALGVSIVVDDFGTGFSALGYLRRHPVTGVKIDQAFVGGLGVNPEDEEIVRAVVAMSAALGLTVVAEGVETASQQQVLAALGVTQGQGWLWDAPLDPSRFIQRWSNPTPAMDAGQVAGGAV